ncbi:MAG TPA: RsfA family transcriptional regulator [Bacilli bacterium]|nr:RsfA family transcriptional regulator [Bacilli bacterium]
MKTVRQDAWTAEDDQVLADLVLRQIREGGTQLQGFQEVGQLLGRTTAACGYRWNAIVRKQFHAQIEVAKAKRRVRRDVEPQAVDLEGGESTSEVQGELSWTDVLHFLRSRKGEEHVLGVRLRQVEAELEGKAAEVERLEEENRELQALVRQLQADLMVVKEDYLALVSIMERARRMVVGTDDDSEPIT